MSLLCVGVSHRSADVDFLGRIAVQSARISQVLDELLAMPHVVEAVVLSTCNRVEVSAAVTGFHGGLADVASVFAKRAGCSLDELAPHLYVHFESAAVQHVFQVASGLDSLVVGETQILGQVRDAYGAAADHGGVGAQLHALMQHSLRVGKRVHTETGLDQAGRSVVTTALERGQRVVGSFAARPAMVIGAGGMGALALATLRQAGARPLFIANRSFERAARLAAAHGATAVAFEDIPAILGTVDTVVTVTAALEPVLGVEVLTAARPDGAPLLVCDLSVPRNVERAVADLPGVTLIDIASLADRRQAADQQADQMAPGADGADPAVQAFAAANAAQTIVDAEVETFMTGMRGLNVAPTVAALRARADAVVGAELNRLVQRRPDLDDAQREEITMTVHRVVQQLLHQPSVRIRELAAEPGGEQYAMALRELFDLQVPKPEGTR